MHVTLMRFRIVRRVLRKLEKSLIRYDTIPAAFQNNPSTLLRKPFGVFPRQSQVPVSGLSFVDRTTGEDKTERARAIMKEKAPELLDLIAQVKRSLSFVRVTTYSVVGT